MPMLNIFMEEPIDIRNLMSDELRERVRKSKERATALYKERAAETEEFRRLKGLPPRRKCKARV